MFVVSAPQNMSIFQEILRGLPPGLWVGVILTVGIVYGLWRMFVSIWDKAVVPWMARREVLEQQRTEQHRLLAAAAESNERSSENNRVSQMIGLERDKYQSENMARLKEITTRLEAVHDVAQAGKG